jgi:hypothetical protein
MVSAEEEEKVPSSVGVHGLVLVLRIQQNVDVKVVEYFERQGSFLFAVCYPGENELQPLCRGCTTFRYVSVRCRDVDKLP